MHDPKTVAFEIYLGSKIKKNGNYREPFITIWHCDPEEDGTDDSCGWFIRERHVNQDILKKIKSEFEFNFKHNYWFDKEGRQVFSTIGTLMLMYRIAAWTHFNYNREKTDRFMRKYCVDIINFAENPTDCGGDDITGRWYNDNLLSKERFSNFARMVYTDILRKERKWFQHPRWHFWHWEIQFHPLQKLKRRWWDKCSKCGKRGFKGSAFGNWEGTEIWHQDCNIDNNLRDSV